MVIVTIIVLISLILLLKLSNLTSHPLVKALVKTPIWMSIGGDLEDVDQNFTKNNINSKTITSINNEGFKNAHVITYTTAMVK